MRVFVEMLYHFATDLIPAQQNPLERNFLDSRLRVSAPMFLFCSYVAMVLGLLGAAKAFENLHAVYFEPTRSLVLA